MSTAILLEPSIIETTALMEKRILCSSLSSPNTISLQTSTNDYASLETREFDGRILGSSDPSESFNLCKASNMLTIDPSQSSFLDTTFPGDLKGTQYSKILQEFHTHGCQNNVRDILQDEYLRFLEPSPVLPPPYETLPPGGCPRFPIFDIDTSNVELPLYSPSAYKLGVIYRKLEWLSPYEPSPSRSWKMFVMELNSTQLNFYSIPCRLESSFLAFTNNQSDNLNIGQSSLESIHRSYRSLVTKFKDVQFHHFCEELEFFKNELKSVDINDKGYDSSANFLSKMNKGQKNKRLVRSYSLQHARFGLASDYSKKPNVLRLRLENEQFLLNFSSTEDLIDWNMGLCMGRDVAMDLALRELPRYRTVPRRRRTQCTDASTIIQQAAARRSRAHCDTQFEVDHGLRGKLYRLKTKLSFQNLDHLNAVNHTGEKSVHQLQVQQLRKTKEVETSMASVRTLSSQSIQRGLNRRGHSVSTSFTSFSIPGLDDDEGSVGPVAPNLSLLEDNYYEDGEEDDQNLSDHQRSDYEDDSEVDPEEASEVVYPIRSHRIATSENGLCDKGDYKWSPFHKTENNRRFIRNCLKCIKPLTFDEPWVNKLLMKPSLLPPLSQVYLIDQCNGTFRDDVSTTSSGSLTFGSASDLSSFRELSPSRIRSSSFKESLLSLPYSSLGKITNHNLREYVVGSHSLIPHEL